MNDLFTTVGALVAGVVIGATVLYLISRELIDQQVKAELDEWRVKELYSVRRESLDRARPEVQRRVGADIASWTHSFPFMQEDPRFVGNPIDYIVFEGYSGVRARQADEITRVTFVRARREGQSDPDWELVLRCVAAGHVEWQTIEVGTAAQPELQPSR